MTAQQPALTHPRPPGRHYFLFHVAPIQPTIVEQDGGSLLMLCRNNDYRDPSAGGPQPWERLLASYSHDRGATWTSLVAIPIDSVVSRMHILRLSPLPLYLQQPRRAFSAAAGGLPLARYVMTDNDWWTGGMVHDRHNAALYFSVGDGTTFAAAAGYSIPGEVAGYPQMALDTRSDPPALLVSYSSGDLPRSIRVARIATLPSPTARHLFPRSDLPRGKRPAFLRGLYLSYQGAQAVTSGRAPMLPARNASFGAWVRVEKQAKGAVIIDNRGGDNGGGVFGITGLAPFVFLPCTLGNVGAPTLRATMYGWSYIGVSVSVVHGRVNVTFAVNGSSETRSGGMVHDSWTGWTGSTASVGFKHSPSSQLAGFVGDIRFAGAWRGVPLTVAQHNYVANKFAASIGRPQQSTAAPGGDIAMWMDPANRTQFEANFELPAPVHDFAGAVPGGANHTSLLRTCGVGSASVELPALAHEACGGHVSMSLRLRVVPARAKRVVSSPGSSGIAKPGAAVNALWEREQSPSDAAASTAVAMLGNATLLSVGDAYSAARLVACSEDGSLWLHSNASIAPVIVAGAGNVVLGTWSSAVVAINTTHVTVAWETGVAGGSVNSGSIRHGATTADVWTYVGEGWYNGTGGEGSVSAALCTEVDPPTMKSTC